MDPADPSEANDPLLMWPRCGDQLVLASVALERHLVQSAAPGTGNVDHEGRPAAAIGVADWSDDDTETEPAQQPSDGIGLRGYRLDLADDEIEIEVPFEPRCLLCRSPWRWRVERMLMMSQAPTSIAETLPETCDLRWSRRSTASNTPAVLLQVTQVARRIARHRDRGHVTGDVAIRNAVKRKALAEGGLDLDDALDGMEQVRTFFADVMKAGYSDLIDGTIRPTLAQAMAAAYRLAEIDTYRAAVVAESGVNNNDLAHVLIERVLDITDQVLSPEDVQRIVACFWVDPVLGVVMDTDVNQPVVFPPSLGLR